MKFPVILLAIFVSTQAFSHKAHKHHESAKAPAPTPNDEQILQFISESYVKTVRPIFEKKCFDCHSSKTSFPWYYQLPGVKQLIDSDIAEAREHLDMDGDFPLKSHATLNEDIEAIRKCIQDEMMPPTRYKIMHSDLAVTDEEKTAILNWTKESLERLP